MTKQNLTENVLKGIPHMGYGDPSAVCYIGSVMRLMEYLNDPAEADECFALSGTAMCFPWKTGLCCDEVSIITEIPLRTFAALGFESEYLYEPNVSIKPQSPDDEAINGQPEMIIDPRKYSKSFYIEKIKNSIDNGRPVVGFGLTELNFSCLITGYRKDGDGLLLRAYWAPHGETEGYGGEDRYFYTESWYEKCCGIIVIGEKTGERLTGVKAYEHIRKTAKILYEKQTEYAQGEVICNNAAAFDDMARWLLNDNWWREGFDTGNREMYLKPVGLLLLNHYRSYLHGYLSRLSEQYPGLVDPAICSAIEQLGEYFPGAHQSRLNLNQCVDPALSDFSMMRDRSMREKVAAYVKRLKKLDSAIFDLMIGTEAK